MSREKEIKKILDCLTMAENSLRETDRKLKILRILLLKPKNYKKYIEAFGGLHL